MKKNSIVVSLPGTDTTTGKCKKVIHDFLIIKNNLEMRHGRIVEFVESDGSPVQTTNELQRQLFLPKQINQETDGKYVDPATGFEVPKDIPNAVSDLEYWQGVEIASYPSISALPQNVRDSLKGITISDLLYWMIEQSILKGNTQGKY